MKKWKIPLIGLTVAFSVLVAGCSDENSQDAVKSVASTPTTTAQDSPLSYEKYMEITKKFSTDYTYSGLKRVTDTLSSPVVVIVDKENTFGKRETLTLTGEKTDKQPKPTQNRVVYQNSDGGYVLYADFIYLNKSLGNDMVSWDNTPPSELEQNTILKKFETDMLSYNNILIKLTMISVKEQQQGLAKELGDVTKSIVTFLQNVQKP